MRGQEWFAGWNSLLSEIGLETRAFRKDATPLDTVAAAVAALIEELGKWPTDDDLRRARRRDESFPSLNVIARFRAGGVLANRTLKSTKSPAGTQLQRLSPRRSVVLSPRTTARRQTRSRDTFICTGPAGATRSARHPTQLAAAARCAWNFRMKHIEFTAFPLTTQRALRPIAASGSPPSGFRIRGSSRLAPTMCEHSSAGNTNCPAGEPTRQPADRRKMLSEDFVQASRRQGHTMSDAGSE